MTEILICANALIVRHGSRAEAAELPGDPASLPAAFRKAVSAVRARGKAIGGLPGSDVAVLKAGPSATDAELRGEASRLLRIPSEEVLVSRTREGAAAVSVTTLTALRDTAQACGLRVVRWDLSACALLRACGGGDRNLLIAFLSPWGCEIAVGGVGGIVVARTVGPSEVATEVSRTLAYAARIGAAPDEAVVCGWPRDAVERLRTELGYLLTVPVRAMPEVGPAEAAAAVAREEPPSFRFAPPRPRSEAVIRTAAYAALLGALVAASVGVTASRMAGMRAEELERLQGQSELMRREVLLRKPDPQAQAVLRRIREERLPLDVLEALRELPDDAWAIRFGIGRDSWRLTGMAMTSSSAWEAAKRLGAVPESVRQTEREGVRVFEFVLSRRTNGTRERR